MHIRTEVIRNEEKIQLEDPRTDGRKILKSILKK